MTLPRTPEPELMNAPDQAAAYAAADFAAPHAVIMAALTERMERPPACVLDIGCGPADISVRVARGWPGCRVDGIDGAPAMLAEARARVAAEGLAERVRLHRVRIPEDPLPARGYDLVVSNSLLHHLHRPDALWQSLRPAAAPGATVFVADLLRPETAAEADALVERFAADEADILQRDFRASLHAAFTVAEVADQLERNGLPLRVEPLDDHHLFVFGRLPAS